MSSKHPKRKPRPGVDEYGRTPLHYAARDGNAEDAKALLAAGLDPATQDDEGWTPLHFAAQAVSPQVTEILLAAGANPELRDIHGNTVLWRAVMSSKGRGGVIQLLLSVGANARAHNLHGVSPLDIAQSSSHNLAQFFAELKNESEA